MKLLSLYSAVSEHSVGETTALHLFIKKEASSTQLSSQTRKCALSSLAAAPAAALSLHQHLTVKKHTAHLPFQRALLSKRAVPSFMVSISGLRNLSSVRLHEIKCRQRSSLGSNQQRHSYFSRESSLRATRSVLPLLAQVNI